MRYIIELNPDCFDGEFLRMPIRLAGEDQWIKTKASLTPYTEPDRKAIEDEVWELARRIICPSDCCVDSISAHTKEIFNKDGWEIRGIFNDLSYQEVKAKYEAWLKQKDEIHVGDEVKYPEGYEKVVTVINSYEGYFNAIDSEGNVYHNGIAKHWEKTGRTFPEVAELLEKMRGEEE